MNLTFTNPVYGGQDPFVCKGKDGKYYFIAESSDSRSLELYISDKLTDRGVAHVVYTANESGESSHDIWAPEIWNLNDKWYIYYAGAEGAGQSCWETHRMFVLEADRPEGPYRFAGKLELGEAMSIDGTVMELPDGSMIFIYMRKHKGNNCLFMADMKSPTEISGEPKFLAEPTFPWEADINEGPFPIIKNGNMYIMYSANAAHLPGYCIALLKCKDGCDPHNSESWEKLPEPIYKSSGSIQGPGHACIVKSPDDSEDWLVFHSKFDNNLELPGGWNRVVNLAKITWTESGIPIPKCPDTYGDEYPVPSGEKGLRKGKGEKLHLGKDADRFCEYRYFRANTISKTNQYTEIDSTMCPEFGDKILLRNQSYCDINADITMSCVSECGSAGFIFRVNLPAAGIWNWRGYGVFLTKDGNLSICRSDSGIVTILAETHIPVIDIQNLRIEAVGSSITVYDNKKILLAAFDDEYTEGQVGFVAINSKSRFYELKIQLTD